MAHANAMLTPKARLKLAQLVVEHHWTITEAAKHYMVSWPTAKRWVTRYLEHGREGMEDKSSRPPPQPKPNPAETGQSIVALRKRLGPVLVAGRLGIPASNVHAVLGPQPGQQAPVHRPDHRRTNPPLSRQGRGRKELQNLRSMQRLHPFQQTPQKRHRLRSHGLATDQPTSPPFWKAACAHVGITARRARPTGPTPPGEQTTRQSAYQPP